MNILAVLGSPRKNGNTDLLLKKYIEGASSVNDDAKIETIFLQEKNISPCTSCYACKKGSKRECIINDDMKDIYPKIKEADVMVLATPIYWWNISAQLKIFIDRWFGLGGTKDFGGKKFVLLMTYGGALPNLGPELAEKSLREICDYLKMDVVQVYGVCTDEYMPVAENEEALKEVYELGKKIKFL